MVLLKRVQEVKGDSSLNGTQKENRKARKSVQILHDGEITSIRIQTSLWSTKIGKSLPRFQIVLDIFETLPDGLNMVFASWYKSNFVRLRVNEQPLMVRLKVEICYVPIFVNRWRNSECPQQSSYNPPLGALCQMNAHTDTSTGSVRIMISVHVVRATSIVHCELWMAEIPVWIVRLCVFVLRVQCMWWKVHG